MTGPSDAAVEAAAGAFARKRNPKHITLDGHSELLAMRAALSAALPVIREELAQEIEAGIDDAPEVFSESADWVDGMTNAGCIVRGEGA